MRLKMLFALILLLVTVATTFASEEPTIVAKLNTNTISIENNAQLTVTVTGSRSPEIIMPQVAGLTFFNRGTSTMINIINGNFTKSSSTNFVVQADQEGVYTIPPVAVEIKGKIYKTEPLNLVVKGNKTLSTKNTLSENSEQNDIAFIEVEFEGDHFIGEQVPVIIRGFFSDRYKMSIESLPALSGDGVIMAPLSKKPKQARARVGNKTYDIVEWTTTLSAIKEGEHKLQLHLTAAVYTVEQNRRNPFNDPYFDSFFNNTKKTRLNVSSEEFVFKALALPEENQPENFTGAVGEFSLQLDADPIIVDVGEPITITTTISGQGSFDSVHAPVFPESDDWKTYKPSNVEGAEEENRQKKVFQQVIIPKKAGLEEVPAISFSYFNPKKKIYETSKSKPVAIHVKKSKILKNEQNQTAPKESVEENWKQNNTTAPSQKTRLYTNLLPQHLETGTFSKKIEPVFKKIWFISAVLICLSLIVLFSLFHLYNQLIGKNPERELQKKKRKLLETHFIQLKTLCNNNQADNFMILARSTVQKYYSLILELPPEAISAATLETKKLDNTMAKTILESADRVTFGGQRPDKNQMESWLKALKKELV